MESLPSHVIQDIVFRVPAESVLECKLVCKKWITLIRERNFTKMHLSRQLNHLHGGDEDGNDNLVAKVDPCLLFACRVDDYPRYRNLLFHGGQPSDRISNDGKYIFSQNLKRIYHPPMHDVPMLPNLVGSCNGLVCILDPVYICNPLTREYVYLPELVVKKEDVLVCMFETACGFGYVRSTNEYKVVRIHYLEYRVGDVEVYTLGSGCGWRAVGKVSHQLDMVVDGGKGIYANDAIYWTSFNKVVAFDLAKEEFKLLSGPPCMENRRNEDRFGLVALGSHLCLYLDKLHIEIWSLMKYSKSNETWCMEYDIDYKAAILGSRKRNFRPILLTKNEEVIFLYDKSVLYSYNTKTTLLKSISNEASTDYIVAVDAIVHVNTFASLEALGEPSKRFTVSPRRVRTPWDDVIDELDSIVLGEELDTWRFRLR